MQEAIGQALLARLGEEGQAKGMTLQEYAKEIQAVEDEAVAAMPFALTECSFSKGFVSQAIWSCLTCAADGRRNGVCATCSVRCHADHEQVELFTKRSFRCDCGTTQIGEKACCDVGKRVGQPIDKSNTYDATFDNLFCVCRTKYDPETEEDVMMQCLCCENWYHSRCIPGLRSSAFNPEPNEEEEEEEKAEPDFICSACATGPLLAISQRYAAKTGTSFNMLDKEGNVYPKAEPTSLKRKAEDEPEEINKRARIEGDADASEAQDISAPSTKSCTAPSAEPSEYFAQSSSSNEFTSSLFLLPEPDWRAQLCRCSDCMPLYKDFPYLLEKPESLEMEEENEKDVRDSQSKQLKEQLEALPRDKLAEGIQHVRQMGQRFVQWSESLPKDQVVTKEMIDGFLNEQARGS